ncbi:Pentacotripeptide-repeat region of PRORP domain-containing protein [Plasmodiophora brassicae]
MIVSRLAIRNGRRAFSAAFHEFFRRPSLAGAVRALQHDNDPARGWAVFERCVQLRLRPLDVPFFMRMLQFCQRAAPSKATDVLRTALGLGVAVNESMFCLYVGACKRAAPAALDDALDVYTRSRVPRTRSVISHLADLCRTHGRPESALSLVSDAFDNRVDLSEALLATFAACCADAAGASARAADTVDRLVGRLESRQIEAYPQPAIYDAFATAALSHGRVETAFRIVRVLQANNMAPSHHLSSLVLGALVDANRPDDALSVFRLMVRPAAVDPAVFARLVACCSGRERALQDLYRHATDASLLENAAVASAFQAAAPVNG